MKKKTKTKKRKSIPGYKRKHLFIIENEVLPCEVLFCTNNVSIEDVASFVKKQRNYTLSECDKKDLKLGSDSNGKCVSLDNGAILVRVKSVHTQCGVDLVTVVHELSHAVHQMFKYIGYKVDNDNDEMFAYNIAFLFKKILNRVDK